MGRFLGNPENLESYENSVTIPKSPVGEFIRNDEEMEVEDEESLNDLLKTVLITLRDHPDIIMDILQGNYMFLLFHSELYIYLNMCFML